MAELAKFSRLKGNLGRGTRLWCQIWERKWKYGRFVDAQCIGHNYRNSSIIVDLPMGQMARSTDRSCVSLFVSFLPCLVRTMKIKW